MKLRSLLLVFVLMPLSCTDTIISVQERDFNFIFKYGVDAKNVLNTFNNLYTKNLLLDGSITVPFMLTDNEMQSVYQKMLEIDFFKYPQHFVIYTRDTIIHYLAPYATYDYEVEYESITKHVHWKDSIIRHDSSAIRLKELINLIENIIQSSPQYLQLSPARCGYL